MLNKIISNPCKKENLFFKLFLYVVFEFCFKLFKLKSGFIELDFHPSVLCYLLLGLTTLQKLNSPKSNFNWAAMKPRWQQLHNIESHLRVKHKLIVPFCKTVINIMYLNVIA